jgi:hypothetical protein
MGQCGVCGALLVAGLVVCEHAEPLVEELLHREARAGIHRPAAIELDREHPPESLGRLPGVRLTYEISQATGELTWLPITSTVMGRRRSWHPTYYATGPVEPILALASGSL